MTTFSQSWCQRCIATRQPPMLTGYGLYGSRCDHCGRIADLAMVRVSAELLLTAFLEKTIVEEPQ